MSVKYPLKYVCKTVAIYRWNGLAMAGALSRGSLTLDTKAAHVGFVVDKGTL